MESRALVQVKTAAGPRWGVVLPEPPQLTAVRSQPFARPFFQQWVPLQRTTLEEDALVEERWGVALGFRTGIVACSAGPALPRTKDHAKFELWVAATKKALEVFSSCNWQTAFKEGSLRSPLAAAAQLYASAASEGHEDIHTEVSKWMAGLGTIKKLIFSVRNHSKTKAKVLQWSQLAELAEPLKTSGEFLVSLGIAPAVSFKLLALRASLSQLVSDKKAFAGPMRAIGRSLVEAFAVAPKEQQKKQIGSHSTGATVNPSLWLRSVFSEALGAIVPKAGSAEELPKQARALLEDLRDASDAIKEAFGDAAPVDFMEDVAAVCEILAGPAGGTEKQSPTVLKTALGRLRSDSLVAVQLALESAVWSFCTSAAACAMQMSSKDSLADAKLERALAILRDPRLPHLVVPAAGSDATTALTQCDFVVSGALLEALDESLQCVAEAQALWSDMQAEVQTSLGKTWAELLVATTASLNEVQWLCLAGCFAKAGVLADGEGGEPTGATADSLEALAKMVDEVSDDETPLLSFGERAAKCFASFPRSVQEAKGIDAVSGRLTGSMSESIQLRSGVVEVVAA